MVPVRQTRLRNQRREKVHHGGREVSWRRENFLNDRCQIP